MFSLRDVAEDDHENYPELNLGLVAGGGHCTGAGLGRADEASVLGRLPAFVAHTLDRHAVSVPEGLPAERTPWS